MTEFENLSRVMKDDKSLFEMKNKDIHQILNQLIDFRTTYRKNIFEKYVESYQFELIFTEYLENKVAIPNVKYSWIFNESGSGSSEYGYTISFLEKKYNLIISKIWDTKKAILTFSEYNKDDEGDEENEENEENKENYKFKFEIEEGESVELPEEVFDLYACSGREKKDILVNLMVHIAIISGAICTLKVK